jgi:soluble lytic murein transglycosylase
MTNRYSTWKVAGAILLFCWGWLDACSSQKPLIVPTTPPSERNENPGLDQTPETPQESSTPPQACASAEDCFATALQLADQGNREAAVVQVRVLRDKYPGSPQSKQGGFLLGRWAAEKGSPEADSLLSQAILDLPSLEEYALYFMAENAVKLGQYPQAVQTYDRLIQKYPESVIAARAAFQKADAWAQSGDCPTAITQFQEFVTRFSGDSNAGKALLRLADCALKLGDSEKAVWALQRVWFFYADSPEAPEAQKSLQKMGTSGVSIPAPSVEARYQRGRTLFDAARYDEAAVEFKALLAAGEPGNRDDVSLKLGETLIQLKQYDDANRVLEDLARRTGRPDLLTSALFWMGRVAIRQGDEGRSLQMERKLADRFPTSPDRAKLLFMIGDFYEDRHQIEQALKTYHRVIAETPGDPSAEDAVWRIGWIAYKTGRYDDAIRILGDYWQQHPASLSGGQFGYWIGRSAEQIHQPAPASQAYRRVCRDYLRSFYCQQAQVRLAGLQSAASEPGMTDPRPEVPFDDPKAGSKPVNGNSIRLPNEEASPALTRDRHYSIALELMALHLEPEAAQELSYLTDRYATDKPTVLKLSGLLYDAGDYHRSLRLLRLYFQDVLEKGGDEIPQSFWEQAYPYRFVEWVQHQSPAVGTDPYLVAAVAREESAFDSKAVSKVGALGLMQLMPYTGEWVAKRVGLDGFRPELLLDEATNLHLGAWYLGHLIEQFNGNMVLAVASYNAGPEAVGRWAEKGVGNLDEFIESIPFNETRYFTKKVMRSYHEYRRIAGADSVQPVTGALVSP